MDDRSDQSEFHAGNIVVLFDECKDLRKVTEKARILLSNAPTEHLEAMGKYLPMHLAHLVPHRCREQRSCEAWASVVSVSAKRDEMTPILKATLPVASLGTRFFPATKCLPSSLHRRLFRPAGDRSRRTRPRPNVRWRSVARAAQWCFQDFWAKAKAALDKAVVNARAEATTAAGASSTPIVPWSIHDLRRTVATGLQRLGVRLEVIESVLNHISGSRGGIAGVHQRHDWAAEKRGALDARAVHILTVVEGRRASPNVVTLVRAG
jgi:hypothetical protein